MTLKRYEVPADVRMRLHQSIVMYRGIPVWVSHIPDTLNIQLVSVRDDDKIVADCIDASHPDLDITSVPLGYSLSTKKLPNYVYRLPLRQQKQGVCQENTAYTVDNGPAYIQQRGLPVHGPRLADLIEGNYPSVEAMKKSLSAGARGFAFHRKYAVVRDEQDVMYMKFAGHTMGFFDPSSMTASLLPPFHENHHRALLYKLGIKSEVIGNVIEDS